jgi:hypothetical protein
MKKLQFNYPKRNLPTFLYEKIMHFHVRYGVIREVQKIASLFSSIFGR